MNNNPPTPEVEQLLRQVETRLDRKEYSSAIKLYNKILEINPQDSWTYWERAMIKKAANDISGAMKDLSLSIELDPTNSFAFFQRGLLREKSGDKKGAEADFEKADRLREENPPEKSISQRPKMDKSISSTKEKDGRSALDYIASSNQAL